MRLWVMLCVLLLWGVGAVCAFIIKKIQPWSCKFYIAWAVFVLILTTTWIYFLENSY